MCVCVRETFLAKCPLLGGIAPILQGKLHLGHSHEVSFLPWEAGLPKQKENLGERQLEAAQHPPPPRKHIVMNWELFTAGREEVFGCKLSCTVAVLEKATES